MNRHLNRSKNRNLNQLLNRRLDRHSTRMLGGIRRPPPPDYLREVCQAVSLLIKSHKRLAKIAPHLFDYVEVDRRQRELEQERQRDAIIRPALDRIYGPDDHSPLIGAPSPGGSQPQAGKESVNKR